MLKRILTIALGTLFLLGTPTTASACTRADCTIQGRVGDCEVQACPEIPNSGSGGEASGKTPSIPEPDTPSGPVETCTPAQNPPPTSHAVWQGNTTGTIMDCRRPVYTGSGGNVIAWDTRQEWRAAPVNAEAVALRIAAKIGFQAIDIGYFPYLNTDRTIVSWHTWLWAKNPSQKQWGTITSSETEQGVTVSITATPKQLIFNMGDGGTERCDTPGRAWPEGKASHGDPGPTNCSYKYKKTGRYTITATTVWHITWSGNGTSGSFTHEVSNNITISVTELRTVNTKPDRPRPTSHPS